MLNKARRARAYVAAIIGVVSLLSAGMSLGFAASSAESRMITAASLEEFGDQLTLGHQRILQRIYGFAIPLYPARALPDKAVAEAPSKSTAVVMLNGGTTLEGYSRGIPFPEPETGLHVLWNSKMRYRGRRWGADVRRTMVYPSGQTFSIGAEDYYLDARPVDSDEPAFFRLWKFEFPDGRPRGTNQDGLHWKEVIGGSSDARNLFVTFGRGFTKRIALAPTEGHIGGGLSFRPFDMVDMYSGSLTDKTYKLLGRRAFVVPYVAEQPIDQMMTLEAFAQAGAPDLQAAHYQQTEVWVVDMIEIGDSHAGNPTYRRRFYVDPLTWTPLVIESYDDNDKLQFMQECHLNIAPGGEGTICRPQVLFSFQDDDRYFIEYFVIEDLKPLKRAGSFSASRIK